MITRVIISGYRCFKHLDFVPYGTTNLVVGANEAGKSTLLEAIALALTGRINGRWATEELNPFWFHRPSALAYFGTSCMNRGSCHRLGSDGHSPPRASIASAIAA